MVNRKSSQMTPNAINYNYTYWPFVFDDFSMERSTDVISGREVNNEATNLLNFSIPLSIMLGSGWVG
jgi:hypothetical protein